MTSAITVRSRPVLARSSMRSSCAGFCATADRSHFTQRGPVPPPSVISVSAAAPSRWSPCRSAPARCGCARRVERRGDRDAVGVVQRRVDAGARRRRRSPRSWCGSARRAGRTAAGSAPLSFIRCSSCWVPQVPAANTTCSAVKVRRSSGAPARRCARCRPRTRPPAAARTRGHRGHRDAPVAPAFSARSR